MQDLFRSISLIFRDAGANDQAREAVVFAAWHRAAGHQLSEHTAPIRYVNRRLIVAVSGVRWKQQMQDLSGQMVFRLNGAFGIPVLNFIEFVVNEEAVEKELEHRRSLRNISKPEGFYRGPLPPEVVEAAAAIHDPELRRNFLAAAGECIERPSKRNNLR